MVFGLTASCEQGFTRNQPLKAMSELNLRMSRETVQPLNYQAGRRQLDKFSRKLVIPNQNELSVKAVEIRR